MLQIGAAAGALRGQKKRAPRLRDEVGVDGAGGGLLCKNAPAAHEFGCTEHKTGTKNSKPKRLTFCRQRRIPAGRVCTSVIVWRSMTVSR
jgi:hypothetical protein